MSSNQFKDIPAAVIYLGEIAIALTAIGVFLRMVVVMPLRRWFVKNVRTPLATLERGMSGMRKELKDHIDGHDHSG